MCFRERVELRGGGEAPLEDLDRLGQFLRLARLERGEELVGRREPGRLEDCRDLTSHALPEPAWHLGKHVPLQVHCTPLTSCIGQVEFHRRRCTFGPGSSGSLGTFLGEPTLSQRDWIEDFQLEPSIDTRPFPPNIRA